MQHKKTHQNPNIDDNRNNKKWATFTYYSPKARKITSLFRHANTGIAFKSYNALSHLTKPQTPTSTQNHNKSGIYKLTCNTCKMSYVRQTSQNLKLRYQEHICYIKNNDPQSAYAQHILSNQHEYRTIEIMTLLKPTDITPMLIPYEQLYIHIIILSAWTTYPRTKPR